MLRAWRHRSRCRTPQDPWAWIAAITRNEARRRLGEPRHSDVALDVAEDVATQDEALDRVPERVALQRALATLSPRDRSIVLLHYGADLTVARVAEELRIPEGTVKVTLHRIRSKLRVHLSP